jgi:hypothetical protein
MNENIPSPENDPLARYAAREQARKFVVPAGFSERVAQQVSLDVRRSERRQRFMRVGGMALAASVLLAVGLTLPRMFREDPKPTPNHAEVAALPKLGEQWSEAGRSLENLTANATKPAVEPARLLIASAEGMHLPTANPENAALPEFEFTEIAIAGLEPVANQPRRAVNTLLRDFGIAK